MASTSLHLPAFPLGSRENLPSTRRLRSVFAAVIDALANPRRSELDREAAALIEGSGGKFTDSLERAIERRLFDRH
jgi:hypothetical protein